MRRLNLHTPDGTSDILPAECAAKRGIENNIAAVFASYGYNCIQTPTFEYYDVFKDEWGAVRQETVLKFIGEHGHILALRPDITTSISRVAATKYSASDRPLRLYYIGSAFRNSESFQGALQKEFTQAGIELLGQTGPEADAEVIAVIINAIRASGLKDFQVELGQVEFFKSLTAQAGLDGEAAESIRQYIDRKDFMGLDALLDQNGVKGGIKEIISNLPSLFGGAEALDNARGYGLGAKASDALDYLCEVYKILTEYGLEGYISIDLGMVRSIEYYTGVIFRVLARGMGFSIGGGGRYDGLARRFGADMPSTGGAVGVDRLLSALYRNGASFEAPKPDCIIGYTPGNRGKALEIASALRLQGLAVEQYYGMDIDEFAKSRGVGGYITVTSEDMVEITDLKGKTAKKVGINELLTEGRP